jgi:hypothetical protein
MKILTGRRRARRYEGWIIPYRIINTVIVSTVIISPVLATGEPMH